MTATDRPPDDVRAAAPRSPRTSTKLIRFLVVGGSSAALDLGLLIGLREVVGMTIPVATTIAFWTALIYNFALNRRWAFAAGGVGVGVPLLRYLVVVAVNYLLTLGIVTGGVALAVPYPVAKVVAIAVGACMTFIAYDRWVFRSVDRG